MRKFLAVAATAVVLAGSVTSAHAIRYCCTHAPTPWYASILGLILSE
jgi:hypothetical protein